MATPRRNSSPTHKAEVGDELRYLDDPMFVFESSPYRSFCVSAERIGYTPILLETVKNHVKEYK